MIGSLFGVNIIESPHATAEPSATPHTDDMRAMIDDLRARGQVHRIPAVFQTAQGVIMHPTLYRELRERLRRGDEIRLPRNAELKLWR